MCIFYDQNNQLISKENFIELYSAGYFFDHPSIIKGVKKNSCIVEQEIEEVLKNGISCRQDVMKILGWKTGKINQRACEEGKPLVYYRGWENVENYDVWLYGNEIKMERFCNFIVENLKDLKGYTNNNPQKVLCLLSREAPLGIGTVYFLTFLYFISEGACPIFDKYADKALAEICDD